MSDLTNELIAGYHDLISLRTEAEIQLRPIIMKLASYLIPQLFGDNWGLSYDSPKCHGVCGCTLLQDKIKTPILDEITEHCQFILPEIFTGYTLVHVCLQEEYGRGFVYVNKPEHLPCTIPVHFEISQDNISTINMKNASNDIIAHFTVDCLLQTQTLVKSAVTDD